jgi:hypothetical protein
MSAAGKVVSLGVLAALATIGAVACEREHSSPPDFADDAGPPERAIADPSVGWPIGPAPASADTCISAADAAALFGAETDAGSACSERPVLPCTLRDSLDTPQLALNRQLEALETGCGAQDEPLEVDFAGGCATRVIDAPYAAYDEADGEPVPSLECFAPQVFALHFACADALACGHIFPVEYPAP